MRHRWYHKPLLHSPALGLEKKVTWLELFYDLIFVAAFIQLGNGLSKNVSVLGAITFCGVFAALWVAWSGFTFYMNRYTVDDFVHRFIVLVQMFGVGAMAIFAPKVLEGQTVGFSVAAGVSVLMVAVMHGRIVAQLPEGRDYSRYWGSVFAIAGLIYLGSALLPHSMVGVAWAVATLAVLGAPLSKPSRILSDRYPIDFEHLSERYGLLTIIVLGESFVKVLTEMVDQGGGVDLYFEASVVLLITVSVWWVYFDDVAGAEIRKGPGNWIIWLYAHLPLQMGVTAVGVAVKKAVHFNWDEPAGLGYRWLLSGALAATYLAVSTIDSVTERRQAELSDRARVNGRIITAIMFLVLAPAGRTMSGGMFLSLITVLCLAQVVFDMMMAPFEESAHSELGTRGIAELAHERRETGERTRIRRDVTEALRKGAPSELRRDLYFYFIEGSWTRVFGAFAFIFLLANVFFAALYVLEPASISGARPRSFADAFHFSVQTMSTIGYGALTPATAYGNAIVAAEAALGMIGIAIITGLVFAKASRPKAGVLFSQPILLTRMHGKDVLMFRVGNARGNEIVDATMHFTVMKEEISAEGHHLRRLHDLSLTRSRSPMFVLSWLVMHEIDDDSPLKDVDWDAPDASIVAFIATMVGHDGTYGQTVYSRHMYHCEQLRRGHRFVDIMSELEDGRLMIDYHLFHATHPEAPQPGGEPVDESRSESGDEAEAGDA